MWSLEDTVRPIVPKPPHDLFVTKLLDALARFCWDCRVYGRDAEAPAATFAGV
jgi:hypothetical protein